VLNERFVLDQKNVVPRVRGRRGSFTVLGAAAPACGSGALVVQMAASIREFQKVLAISLSSTVGAF
jgi:hypothetical protein